MSISPKRCTSHVILIRLRENVYTEMHSGVIPHIALLQVFTVTKRRKNLKNPLLSFYETNNWLYKAGSSIT